ncbi:sigma-54-dependent Fis family transcriptional regulator [Pseudorhodoferax sp. Leaf265]|uniref:sigma-54-dependent Fis family transcriptional regulator n=1 Tax=Pseudorhodoferax sp. Leaf265 TaxID=1736315 RepID=UPI0006F9A3F9|nr:sigma-54-dependent Fis family transcriptional regulator [Pseudorhodoferax sp. Leaf265]KQP21049.1 AAA family ATPase [Pseudorhodoferax sp. Leaf265]
MPSVRSSHIDNVVRIGSSAAAGISGAGPQAIFHKSWTRCMQQHGLDPTRPTPARILPSGLVRDHQQRMDGFMRVARAGMQDLYGRVADLGYMLLLTDADGITVDYIGNPASEPQLKAAGLTIGADWNEAHAGTCGVGTCLVEQATITCHQAEHFDATHIALTCTSAPLRAPNGQLLGVLDVSALHSPEARESQHLVQHLTAMYAQMIEDANFLRCFARHAVLRLGTVPGLVEVSGDVMFALDDDGVVCGANTGARRRFGGRAADLVGQPLTQLLDIGMDALRNMARSGAPEPVALGGPHRREQFQGVMIPPRGGGTAAPGPVATDADCREPPARARDRRCSAGHARQDALDRLLGDDAVMRGLVDQSKRLVDSHVHLLIRGETGAGKEVLARALHAYSARAAQPFVAVNCASIPESLIESELFGYTPGSFTGGKSKGMKGLIAQSDGGTLFLDEIGDMPLALQTRLLRVLAESEVLPLGAERPIAVRLNVIAATHRDLREAIAAGSFREDLYYRLAGATLALPPLRARADRQFLIEKLFAEEAQTLGLHPTLHADALRSLLAHDWPGNVRELRNALRFALAQAGDRPVGVADLPPEVSSAPARRQAASAAPAPTAREAWPAAEAEEAAQDIGAARLLDALKAHRWNIASTARTLQRCRATIYRQMKRYGITQPHLQ